MKTGSIVAMSVDMFKAENKMKCPKGHSGCIYIKPGEIEDCRIDGVCPEDAEGEG